MSLQKCMQDSWDVYFSEYVFEEAAGSLADSQSSTELLLLYVWFVSSAYMSSLASSEFSSFLLLPKNV